MDIIREFTSKGKFTTLWAYCVSSYMMRGMGYYDKSKFIKDFSDLTSKSNKTVYRQISNLLKEGLIKDKKGVLYITGKKEIKSNLKINSKNCIRIQENILKDIVSFKKICVSQTALLLQRRFRYAYSNLKENTESLFKKGAIQNLKALPDRKEKVGVSLSKIAEYLGISKSTVKNLLSGSSKKRYANKVRTIFYREAKEMFNSGFFTKNYMYSWGINPNKKGTYILFYKLSDVYTFDTSTTKSKY